MIFYKETEIIIVVMNRNSTRGLADIESNEELYKKLLILNIDQEFSNKICEKYNTDLCERLIDNGVLSGKNLIMNAVYTYNLPICEKIINKFEFTEEEFTDIFSNNQQNTELINLFIYSNYNHNYVNIIIQKYLYEVDPLLGVHNIIKECVDANDELHYRILIKLCKTACVGKINNLSNDYVRRLVDSYKQYNTFYTNEIELIRNCLDSGADRSLIDISKIENMEFRELYLTH